MPMPYRPPDRALRRLVADLASARPDDVEAILAALEPGEREAVETLLEDSRGRRAGAAPAADSRPAKPDEQQWALEGISPWLANRLAGGGGRKSPPLTPIALHALRRAAEPFRPGAEEPVRLPPPMRNRSLISRIGSAVARRRM
ncbi:hypothetical protein [Allosphingosinicella sp.]|jgi:hypothetical protein|uniref:hypothetical protein n=1 Tax=Allosphingosinicella sp. TaxID=2823234 RepID=UPI002EFE6F10